MDLEPFTRELIQRIEQEYHARGDKLGWRLLYSPHEVLDKARVALIGLNPAGDSCPEEHPKFATYSGSAYVEESWGDKRPGESPLQQQVCWLFDYLREKPEKVLAGNLVPFRSPRWEQLLRKNEAIHFGRAIWTDILNRARPSLVIGMSGPVRDALKEVLDLHSFQRTEVGWGNVAARQSPFSIRDYEGNYIGVPHLSTFQIMGRLQSAEAIDLLFGNHRR